MKDYIIWEQGGQRNVIFTKHIIYIEENETNGNRHCDIHLVEFDGPIKSSLSLQQILDQLE
jgi:hypothetical protein